MDAHARNTGLVFGSLLASGATLLCCVLPAVLVSLGAGATLVSLVTAVPQLVWLSEQKPVVFAVAGLLLLGSGLMIWRARRLPCPANPAAARTCARLRRINVSLHVFALASFLMGATFAFVLPALRS